MKEQKESLYDFEISILSIPEHNVQKSKVFKILEIKGASTSDLQLLMCRANNQLFTVHESKGKSLMRLHELHL